MMDDLKDKTEALRRRFQEMGSAVVAFSGGVDSAVLVAVASEELAGRMIVATAVSPSLPDGDRKAVGTFCRKRGIGHIYIESTEFDDPQFIKNPENRCYFCKSALYRAMLALADRKGLAFVVEGTNASDLSGHRPGYMASKENPRVVNPLVDCGFTKSDVRALAESMAIECADKPAAACLASRIPTGVSIDPAVLTRIDRAEDVIRASGIRQVRVRHHGDAARVEVEPADIEHCIERRLELDEALRKLGWKHIALDMRGYRNK